MATSWLRSAGAGQKTSSIVRVFGAPELEEAEELEVEELEEEEDEEAEELEEDEDEVVVEELDELAR
jgi:hypothetical protein